MSMLVPPRAQISSGSGSAFWAKFGFEFHRVFKFQQNSGSGLSGFTSKFWVLGFIGFGFRFYKKVDTKQQMIHHQLNEFLQNWLL